MLESGRATLQGEEGIMKRQRSYLVINLWTFNELLIAKTLRDGVEIRNNIELIKLIALCGALSPSFK